MEIEDFNSIFGMRLPALAAMLSDAVHRLNLVRHQPGTA